MFNYFQSLYVDRSISCLICHDFFFYCRRAPSQVSTTAVLSPTFDQSTHTSLSHIFTLLSSLHFNSDSRCSPLVYFCVDFTSFPVGPHNPSWCFLDYQRPWPCTITAYDIPSLDLNHLILASSRFPVDSVCLPYNPVLLPNTAVLAVSMSRHWCCHFD